MIWNTTKPFHSPLQHHHHPLVDMYYSSPFPLSFSAWKEKKRGLCHPFEKCMQQLAPLSLADQGTPWTPWTLSAVPLAQLEAPKLAHTPLTDLALHVSPLTVYKHADPHSPSLDFHFTPSPSPCLPRTPRTAPYSVAKKEEWNPTFKSAGKKGKMQSIWTISDLPFCRHVLPSVIPA
jgi:hypothetical protein